MIKLDPLKPVSVETEPRAIGPDLIRAFAILLVMVWHLPENVKPGGLGHYAWLGVDIFFVLSGYLIGTQLLRRVAQGKRPDLADFYLRRAFRILPAFLVVLALYVFVPPFREAPTMTASWRFLTFTMNFGLDIWSTHAFSHAWSLCVEEHFYLLFPILVLLLRGNRSPVPPILLACTILLGGMYLRHELWLRMTNEPPMGHSRYFEMIYYPTYCRLDGLTLGVLLAGARVFYRDWWKRYADARVTLVLGAATIVIAAALMGDTGPVLSLTGAVVGYPLFALGCTLVLAAFLDSEPLLSRWPIPGARVLALISYSLYLTHKAVFHLDDVLIGSRYLDGWAGASIYFGTSILAGSALWFLVERPFLIVRMHLLGSANPAASLAVGLEA